MMKLSNIIPLYINSILVFSTPTSVLMPASAPFYSQIMDFCLMFISVKMLKDVLVPKSYGYVVTIKKSL